MTASLVMALFIGVTWLVMASRKRPPLIFVGVVLALLLARTGVALGVFLLLALPLAWPVFAVAAAVTGALAIRAGGGRRTWARASLAAALAGAAVYGYGLFQTSYFALDLDEHCQKSGYPNLKRSLEFLPLHDSSCGSEAVPAWVNPALAVTVLLLAIFVVAAVRGRRNGE